MFLKWIRNGTQRENMTEIMYITNRKTGMKRLAQLLLVGLGGTSLYVAGVRGSEIYGDYQKSRRANTIEEALTKNTRLAAFSHVSHVFGTINQIEEMGTLFRKNNILFVVEISHLPAAPQKSHAVYHLAVNNVCPIISA